MYRSQEGKTVPNETNDEMEPRRSGKSAAQKARDQRAQMKDVTVNLKAREHS